jgi:hypothetical protein
LKHGDVHRQYRALVVSSAHDIIIIAQALIFDPAAEGFSGEWRAQISEYAIGACQNIVYARPNNAI